MAEEFEPGSEAETRNAVPAGPPEGEGGEGAPGSGPPSPAPSGPPLGVPSWSLGMTLLAGLAVLLTLVGVHAYAQPHADPLALGLGLLLWGLLDLAAQRRGLVVWKGAQAAVGKVVNLVRGLALLGLGLWLCLMASKTVAAANPAVVLWMLVSLAMLYLAAALALEFFTKGMRLGGQAYLLASLTLMFFSYYYFSIPFIFAWAAVFAFGSFAFAAWAVRAGALEESPALTAAVLGAVLVLGAPLLTYTYQQAFVVEEQRLFTPTLLVPRLRQVAAGLSPHSEQLTWAPVHTQPGQPGDVLYSDKIAFVSREPGGVYVKLFRQRADGRHEFLSVRTGPDVRLSSFSNDGSRLAYTWTPSGAKGSSLFVLQPRRAAAGGTTATAGAFVRPRTPFSLRHLLAWLRDRFRPAAGGAPGAFSWRHPLAWFQSRFGKQAPAAVSASAQVAGSVPAPARTAQGALRGAPVTVTATATATAFSWRHPWPWLSRAVASWWAPPVGPERMGTLAYAPRLIAAGAAPEPSHGQVWRAWGRQLYFTSPEGGPANLSSTVERADFSAGAKARAVAAGRSEPAVSSDGRHLLSVGYVPRYHVLDIARERLVDGALIPGREKVFRPYRMRGLFPAWNAARTEVLYLDHRTSVLMIMDANGHGRRVFDPRALDSRQWSTHKRSPFKLAWVAAGGVYSIYRSRPDGRGSRLIYRTRARDVSPPQWSADGARVAFIVRRGRESSIVTVGSDGSWPRRFFITSDGIRQLKWSPDSLKVAWICRRKRAGTREVWTADYRGLHPKRVHVDRGLIRDLTWSPRGKQLAVEQTSVWSFLGLRLIKPDLRNVLMIDLVDDHARVLTRYGIMAWDPRFSPHGDAIAYFTDQHPFNMRPLRPRTAALVISQLF